MRTATSKASGGWATDGLSSAPCMNKIQLSRGRSLSLATSQLAAPIILHLATVFQCARTRA
eukprot:8933679-Pyramimonas_sp.AAC.1